jgi:hypothetical protein
MGFVLKRIQVNYFIKNVLEDGTDEKNHPVQKN